MFNRVFTLIKKELWAQLRDMSSLRMLILPVILQIILFPFAATLEVKNTHIGIYNQDSGKHSIELIQRINHSSAFPYMHRLQNINELKSQLDNQKILIALIFLNDFSKSIEKNKNAKIQILVDGRRSNAAQIATGYLQDIITQYQNELFNKRKINPIFSKLEVHNWFNPNLDYKWFVLPSLIAIITTLGCMLVTAMSVAREREQGTFEQILVSPLTPIFIMIGKIIPALLIATMQASIILLASIFLYRIPFQGSFLLLYLGILCYGLSLSGVGLFISSISETQQQAFLGVFSFLMPAILLSGYIAPIENIPEPLQTLTWLNPVRHFIVISKGIYLKSESFHFIWPELQALLIIGTLTLSLAYIKFKYYSR